MTKLRNWLLLIVTLLAAGAAAGWYFARPAPVVEAPAPELRQADGSLVLERAATGKKSLQVAAVPKGGKVEREISVTVKPRTTTGDNAGGGIKIKSVPLNCPPVAVDLALVRMPDDTRRVVASSPDGEVVGGLDVPVDPIILPASAKRWSAGLSYDVLHQTPGVWVERDIDRLRIGLDLNQTRLHVGGGTATEARVRVGWRW